MSTLKVQAGKPAPAFTGIDQDGNEVSLAALRGKTVILYFYPKDSTPGCTKEACAFRDHGAALADHGAVVLGVSADSSASHRKFADKYELPFTLIADTDRQIIDAYGAWGEKTRCGRTSMGIIRSTVVIGPDGVVKKVYPDVNAATHPAEVLADLAEG